MKVRRSTGRKALNFLICIWATAAAMIGIIALFWITFDVLGKGLSAWSIDFFTHLPTPPGVPGGGVVNAIAGTLSLTGIASLLAIPLGLLAGVFLAEFGQNSRLADNSRFLANVLMGLPSIIIGVFAYAVLVRPLGNFSGYAGAFALAVIMLPVVTRTTEDMLRLVPNTLRESALALGAPRWRVTLGIVFRAAKSGLITGVLLAVARVSGETAPLLFTALNSPFWPGSLAEPTPNLTVTIFDYAMSPYADWNEKAWGASLLITLGVLCLTVLSRWILRERKA
jgi:phosphate transport system permease protein